MLSILNSNRTITRIFQMQKILAVQESPAYRHASTEHWKLFGLLHGHQSIMPKCL